MLQCFFILYLGLWFMALKPYVHPMFTAIDLSADTFNLHPRHARMKSREFDGSVPEWLMGADCKSAGYAYAGSNPARPTTIITVPV